jgi:N-acetylglutamate synthase-like GNAT family acetyltransferase
LESFLDTTKKSLAKFPIQKENLVLFFFIIFSSFFKLSTLLSRKMFMSSTSFLPLPSAYHHHHHAHDFLSEGLKSPPFPVQIQPPCILSEVRRIPCLVKICQNILQNLIPMYGCQQIDGEKLATRDDRNAFIVYDDGTIPVGLFVQKIHLSDKYRDYGIERSLKIKTFFINPELFGQGLRSSVLIEAIERSKMMEASSMYIPVSSLDQVNIEFFQRNGFSLVETVVGNCYGPEAHKNLLFKKIED